MIVRVSSELFRLLGLSTSGLGADLEHAGVELLQVLHILAERRVWLDMTLSLSSSLVHTHAATPLSLAALTLPLTRTAGATWIIYIYISHKDYQGAQGSSRVIFDLETILFCLLN